VERFPLACVLLVAASGLVAEGTVYRWVDAEGNVTYSSQAPPGAEDLREIEIPPGPTEEQRKQAEERLQRNLEKIEAADEARKEAIQKRRESVSEAEEALSQAERNLQDAKRVQPEDWILGYRTSGMKKPEYYQRVEDAEAAVAEAKQRLDKIRGAAR